MELPTSSAESILTTQRLAAGFIELWVKQVNSHIQSATDNLPIGKSDHCKPLNPLLHDFLADFGLLEVYSLQQILLLL
jgi:hypothetical protein